MTLKKYLNLMSVLTVCCWLAWILVIFIINPKQTGLIGFVLFYFSLFLAIVGTGSIVGFIIRMKLKNKPVFKQVEISFRQAIWIALLVILIFIFQGLNLLRWWNTLFLVLFLVFLELFFLTSGKRYKI
ncbi:hypothetical protein IID20_02565 [Patescibacteria group bacterium]|nr:hypothetical protein [Patescibacteria group bacterium]